MIREKCAGILFISSKGNGLFLERSDWGPYAGYFGLPGGHLAKDENNIEAACRETKEEIDYKVDPKNLIEINRQISELEGSDKDFTKEIDYTTFVYQVKDEFIPKLNKEHESYIWAPLNNTPNPLHPGLIITIKKLFADELGIAKMMVAGELPSPQKYMNVTLFDMRITGTGLSYRSGLDEYVWRDSSIYCNDEFLQRCNGLPVIFEHPKGSTLDTKEYLDRNVGMIFLPYIKDDEVWGIAKIYDKYAAKILEENQLSTSPAVVLYGNDEKSILNGKSLLIEGKPKLLDHVALCFAGVWDKQGPPTGVSTVTVKDLIMADEDNKAAALEAAKKADADAGELLKTTINCLDSITARMDEFEKEEKKRADAKAQKRADKQARKDAKNAAKADAKAKTDTEAKAKADAAAAKAKADADAEEEKKRVDAETEMRKRIADVEARLPKQMTDADFAAQADAQMRADRICLMHGRRAPRALHGESLMAYRRRLANDLKEFSTPWKSVDLNVIADDAAFLNIENVIYADAEQVGLHPPEPADDFLREIITEDVTGRKISTFVGRPNAWMKDFAHNKRKLAGIRNSN